MRGTAGGTGSNFIQVGAGEQVSLHLSKTSVVGYQRQGTDLVIKLSDGSSVVLSGYYDAPAGQENKLSLSANGEVQQVLLHDGGADGVLFADYGPVDAWNKYSALDDLRFAESDNFAGLEVMSDEPAGMGFWHRACFVAWGLADLRYLAPARLELVLSVAAMVTATAIAALRRLLIPMAIRLRPTPRIQNWLLPALASRAILP